MNFTNSQSLESYQWKNRLLLILSPDMNSELVQQQVQKLTIDQTELVDRKLILFKITPQPPNRIKSDNDWIKNSEIYHKYAGHKEKFTVVLIGLDGRIKQKQNTLITAEELYALIDAMPMRQAEIKKNE